MKKLLASLLLLSACRYNPTSVVVPDTSIQTSMVRGFVLVSGRADSLHRDYSGVKVEILGTSLFDFTNRDGEYRIPSVPPGNYTVLMSMDGYDTLATGGYVLPPNGLYLSPRTIYKPLNQENFLDSLQTIQDRLDLYPRTLIDGEDGRGTLTLFVGRTPDVSPLPAGHVVSMPNVTSGTINPQTLARRLAIGTSSLYESITGKEGFKQGDSAYVVAYSGTAFYVEPNSTDLHFLNLRGRSNVRGFVVP